MIIPIAVATFFAIGRPSAACPLVTEISGTIEEDTIWTQANSPYVMTGDIGLATRIHLIIASGVIVKGDMATNLTLGNDARLIAIDTESEPIVCTRYKDGEHGGDTYGDGQVSLPSTG